MSIDMDGNTQDVVLHPRLLQATTLRALARLGAGPVRPASLARVIGVSRQQAYVLLEWLRGQGVVRYVEGVDVRTYALTRARFTVVELVVARPGVARIELVADCGSCVSKVPP